MSCSGYRFNGTVTCHWVVMSSQGFELPEHFESSRQHEEEADRLRRGLRAWCTTTDESYDSAQDEDSSGTV